MVDKQTLKLSKLCEHWANHNDSHKDSFIKWRNIARDKLNLFTVAEKLGKAIEMMDECTAFLISAREDIEI